MGWGWAGGEPLLGLPVQQHSGKGCSQPRLVSGALFREAVSHFGEDWYVVTSQAATHSTGSLLASMSQAVQWVLWMLLKHALEDPSGQGGGALGSSARGFQHFSVLVQ